MILTFKPIYSFLNLITLGQGLNKTINGVAVKLPAQHMAKSCSDFEQENIAFLKSYCGEGATILDIGANIGLFAIMAAKIAGEYGKIFSFEPVVSRFEALQNTVRINQLDRLINPVNQAMGKEKSQQLMLSPDEYKKSDAGVSAEMNTIDNFVQTKKLSKINFINIDVDGMEYDTLFGGIQVLKKYKPHVMVAVHPSQIASRGQNMADLYDLLDQLKYNIIYKGNHISKEQFCSCKNDINLHLVPL
jgi:FkbM family methyltransferase